MREIQVILLVLTEVQAQPIDYLYSPEAAIDYSIHVSEVRCVELHLVRDYCASVHEFMYP